MADAISSVQVRQAQVFTTQFFEGDTRETTRNFIDNKTRGVLEVISDMSSQLKGVSDSFGLLSQASKLVTPHLSDGLAEWTDHVSGFTSKARGALAIPGIWSSIKNFKNEMSIKNTFSLISSSLYVSSLFVLDASSKVMSSVGSIFKIGVEGFDFNETSQKFLNTHELCSIEDGVSGEVKSGLNSQWYSQLFKVGKLGLSLITRVASAFAFCTGSVLPIGVGVAVLIGQLTSTIFSIISSWKSETAEFVEYKA
jgi:hypothetical protein